MEGRIQGTVAHDVTRNRWSLPGRPSSKATMIALWSLYCLQVAEELSRLVGKWESRSAGAKDVALHGDDDTSSGSRGTAFLWRSWSKRTIRCRAIKRMVDGALCGMDRGFREACSDRDGFVVAAERLLIGWLLHVLHSIGAGSPLDPD